MEYKQCYKYLKLWVIFADDLIENNFEDTDFDSSPVMCTGCGEVVREDQTLFENGKSCCVYCK